MNLISQTLFTTIGSQRNCWTNALTHIYIPILSTFYMSKLISYTHCVYIRSFYTSHIILYICSSTHMIILYKNYDTYTHVIHILYTLITFYIRSSHTHFVYTSLYTHSIHTLNDMTHTCTLFRVHTLLATRVTPGRLHYVTVPMNWSALYHISHFRIRHQKRCTDEMVLRG